MTADSRTLQFVQQLAANLRPELDLPAFPQVVRRLQMALVREQTTIKDIVGIISSEPVLSARFMQMANSAAMNPNRTPVASLNNAVNRPGFNLVRTVSTAFALRQLSRYSSLSAIRTDLEQVWKTRIICSAANRPNWNPYRGSCPRPSCITGSTRSRRYATRTRKLRISSAA